MWIDSLIFLVNEFESQAIILASSQLITWFSCAMWSVRADLNSTNPITCDQVIRPRWWQQMCELTFYWICLSEVLTTKSISLCWLFNSKRLIFIVLCDDFPNYFTNYEYQCNTMHIGKGAVIKISSIEVKTYGLLPQASWLYYRLRLEHATVGQILTPQSLHIYVFMASESGRLYAIWRTNRTRWPWILALRCGSLPSNFTLTFYFLLLSKSGKATGIVTTSRITDATPAALYAHQANRRWESDVDLPQEAADAGCTDTASQLLENGANITV